VAFKIAKSLDDKVLKRLTYFGLDCGSQNIVSRIRAELANTMVIIVYAQSLPGGELNKVVW
jgi:hypothetical protein